MRSNHAGETGAVYIYRGILHINRDPSVTRFATEHLKTEENHLATFAAWLPKRHQSALLPLWRLAGYLLGAFAAGMGPRWVFTTIDAVETFVVAHYHQQIVRLEPLGGSARSLADCLAGLQRDEAAHREDAHRRTAEKPPTAVERIWHRLVGAGSRIAVLAARVL